MELMAAYMLICATAAPGCGTIYRGEEACIQQQPKVKWKNDRSRCILQKGDLVFGTDTPPPASPRVVHDRILPENNFENVPIKAADDELETTALVRSGAYLLSCGTKIVIGCDQYYVDYEACYNQWLKTPNVLEPRCLPAAPDVGKSDFGSASRQAVIPNDIYPLTLPGLKLENRIPNTVTSDANRHPDNIGDPAPPPGPRSKSSNSPPSFYLP